MTDAAVEQKAKRQRPKKQPAKDVETAQRPSVITPRFRKEVKTDVPVEELALTDRAGKILAFRHRETGLLYQYNAGLANDPNFEAVYMTKDQLVGKVVG